MKWSLTILLVSMLCLPVLRCHSQNTLSFGMKFGLGAQIIPAHTEFYGKNVRQSVQTNPSLTHGILSQYMIAQKVGVESGFLFTYHSYSLEGNGNYLSNAYRKGEEISVFDYQIPILLMYNFEHRYNEMRHFKIVAGTSVDLLSPYFFYDVQFRSLHNFIAGFRIVTDKRTGRIEYYLEHQYSFKRFIVTDENDDLTKDHIDTRLSTLTFSVIWFFAIKELRRAD
jgi:hypothetical protein